MIEIVLEWLDVALISFRFFVRVVVSVICALNERVIASIDQQLTAKFRHCFIVHFAIHGAIADQFELGYGHR